VVARGAGERCSLLRSQPNRDRRSPSMTVEFGTAFC
jgi:hypothetical protein